MVYNCLLECASTFYNYNYKETIVNWIKCEILSRKTEDFF